MKSMDYKIAVLGVGGVGKSAITAQFISSHFVEDYDPTIENSYRKQKVIDGEVAMIDIVDTAGQEAYSCMSEVWLRNVEAYLLVYSITSRISFEELPIYLEKIERARDAPLNTLAISIFGNKTDLWEDRQITNEEAQLFGQQHAVVVFEGSAKGRLNVDEVFDGLVRSLRKLSKPVVTTTLTQKKKKSKSQCSIL